MPWPQTVRTSRQRLCNQRICYLLCSMAMIYNLWDGSLDKRKVRSLVSLCGQDGYSAQVPQHPIDSYRNMTYIITIDMIELSCEFKPLQI